MILEPDNIMAEKTTVLSMFCPVNYCGVAQVQVLVQTYTKP